MVELDSQLAEPPVPTTCDGADPIDPGAKSAEWAADEIAQDRTLIRECKARIEAYDAWRRKRDAGLAGSQ